MQGRIHSLFPADRVVAALEHAPKWTPGLDYDNNPVRVFQYFHLRSGNRDEGVGDEQVGVMPTSITEMPDSVRPRIMASV